MRWRRRRNDPPAPTPEHAEAIKALSKAEKTIEETQEADQEINAVTIQLITFGNRNNFTDMVNKALRAGGNRS